MVPRRVCVGLERSSTWPAASRSTRSSPRQAAHGSLVDVCVLFLGWCVPDAREEAQAALEQYMAARRSALL